MSNSNGGVKVSLNHILKQLSFFFKAIWVFFPGILFLLLGYFVFIKLGQGKDIIYQSTDVATGRFNWTGLYLVLAAIFWVFTTWYTARMIAYSRNDLYRRAPWVLYHFPRLLGYCIFLVLWIAVFLINDVEEKRHNEAALVVGIDLILYVISYKLLEKGISNALGPKWRKRLIAIRWIVRAAIVLSCVIVVMNWRKNNVDVLLYTLPVFQVGFLFLVIVRHPIFARSPGYVPNTVPIRKTKPNDFIGRYMRWAFFDTNEKFNPTFERPIFIVFHVLAIFAFFCYIASISSLRFARELSSFPFVLLAFGILLGVVNMLALLSYRMQTNFNFLLIGVIIIFGFFSETHNVRMLKAANPDEKVYASRMNFRQYLTDWITWHKDSLDQNDEPYPVFFTLADGGASRSGYWTALVLAKMHEDTKYPGSLNRSYFMDHLFCLSGASGGSVGNAVFLSSYALQQQQPSLNTEIVCKEYLGNDFLVFPLTRLLGPEWIKPIFGAVKGWSDRAGALELGMEYPSDPNSPMAKLIRGSLHQLVPDATNKLPILSINTTRVNNGGPALVSTISLESDNNIFGTRADVLDSLPAGRDIRVSTAMVLGARFPYMSPGGRIASSYYVDGGYFDNSGAGVVHEMLLELNRIASNRQDTLAKYIKRMRFYVIHLSNTPYTPAAPEKGIHPVVNDLFTPLLTLAGSYSTQTSVNDARLINYLRETNKEFDSTNKEKIRDAYITFNLYIKDSVESISMNWVISDTVRQKMNRRINHPRKKNLQELIGRMNRRETDSLFHGLGMEN
jgi:hypothetical protein